MATIMDHELADLAVAPDSMGSLAFAHTKPLSIERISPVTNISFVKPKGGLWLAPLREDNSTEWTTWLNDEGSSIYDSHERENFIVTEVELMPEARVLSIHMREDFERILSRYLSMPFLDSGIEFMAHSQFLDFEAMSLDWDALWLTERGQWETRFDSKGSITGPNLYGWDLESVLVLNKNVIK